MMVRSAKRPITLMLSVLLSTIVLVACNESSVPEKPVNGDPSQAVADTPVADSKTDDKPTTAGDVVGGDADKHGCKSSAGYSWCEKTNQCERPWELAKEQSFDNTEDAFVAFCAGSEK